MNWITKYRVWEKRRRAFVEYTPDWIDGVLTFEPGYVGQQFTNQLDVNGVEIYEGDIIATSPIDKLGLDDFVGEVVRDQRGGFRMKSLLRVEDESSAPSLSGFVVVGNVFRRPKLTLVKIFEQAAKMKVKVSLTPEAKRHAGKPIKKVMSRFIRDFRQDHPKLLREHA